MDLAGINLPGPSRWWVLPYQAPQYPAQDPQYPLVNHGNAGNSNAANETFVNHGRGEVQGPLYIPQNGGGLGAVQAGPLVLSGGPTNVQQCQMPQLQPQNHQFVHHVERTEHCVPHFIQQTTCQGPVYYPCTPCAQVPRGSGYSYYKKKSTRRRGFFSGKSHTKVVIEKDQGHEPVCHGGCCRHCR
jgi:hypothetical protein